MLRLSCQLSWFCPCSWSWSQSRSCPWFAPLPWKLPFVQYWSCMFAHTFASVQFATDCHTISPSSIGSNHATWWASWACAATLFQAQFKPVKPKDTTSLKSDITKTWHLKGQKIELRALIPDDPSLVDNMTILATTEPTVAQEAAQLSVILEAWNHKVHTVVASIEEKMTSLQ